MHIAKIGSAFEYLYDFSTQHFINVSAVQVDLTRWDGFPQSDGQGLVIFGSGKYRESDVRLAFQPADSIEAPQSLRYFAGLDAAGQPIWSTREADTATLFSQPCVCEFSVTYNRFLRKWLMLYNCGDPRGINFRTADQPWGPWSESQVLFDPWLDGGYCHFMHVSWQYEQCDRVHDPGRENEWGGEYGPYQFEDLATGDDSTTTIYFTLSTWNPYTVVLMKSTLKLESNVAAVDRREPTLPGRFVLRQNYPNPFNPRTTISYELPDRAHVVLVIVDLEGREVIRLVDEVKQPGFHSLEWNGEDARGWQAPSGVYFCHFEAGDFVRTRKMLLVK